MGEEWEERVAAATVMLVTEEAKLFTVWSCTLKVCCPLAWLLWLGGLNACQ